MNNTNTTVQNAPGSQAGQTAGISQNNSHVAADTAHNQAGSHNTQLTTEIPPQKAIDHYLESLGEHRELSFFNYHICDLPVIIYDAGKGFHTYSSVESMEQGGDFVYENHKIVYQENHDHAVTFDASITSLVCFQWIAMIILIAVFFKVGRRYKKAPDKAPHGLQNMMESVVVYLKQEVILPNIGGKHIADRLEHYFYALFFFILVMNLLGLIPGCHTATGAIGTTLGLALTSFLVTNITSMKEVGVWGWFKHLGGGAPWYLVPIMVPIEIISLFTKPFALTIRLFANMTAGHVVLLTLVGLIIFLQSIFVAPVSVAFSLFMYALELLVAFLQAYIFTILSVVFTGLGVGDHSHEEAH